MDGTKKKKQQNQSIEEQYQQRRVTSWGKGKGNGGRGGIQKGATTGPEGTTPRDWKEREGGDQC